MASVVGAAMVGRRLAQLREQAGLKQAELATRVTMSQAVLSRAEAGERDLGAEELQSLLEAIGTPEASRLKEILAREWRHLSRPPLDHEDQDLFWQAEQTVSRLAEQSAAGDVRPAFATRLGQYADDISSRVALLRRREHHVAFVGPIGAGKSTAICKATGLEHFSKGQMTPVLETGAGGITLCDVSLKVGPMYGVSVTPRSAEEVRADVADFADQVFRRVGPAMVNEAGDEVLIAVPREIERAIRNMSNLRPSRIKGPDGKTIRSDPALELAKTLKSARELVVEILSRMALHRRDRTEAWFDGISHENPLAWIAETFLAINNGRHPEFGLPARVELMVRSLIDAGDLAVSVVDTRGIDGATARADLEERLLDPHTVSILCTGFNDAPEQAIQHLLGRARAIGNPLIDSNCALIVLARGDEALQVKDEAGILAETTDDGYDLKGEQVSNALSQFGLSGLPIEFFNALSDDPVRLTHFVVERIETVRDGFRRGLNDVISNANDLLSNVEQAQVLAVQREASRIVETWLRQHQSPAKVTSHVQDTLLGEIRLAHASTVNAAIRREGEWYSLSYSHQLGFGARRVAVASLHDAHTGFADLCETLAASHPEAAELLTQASRLMSQSYEDMLKKIQIAGATLYREQLQLAQTLWLDLNAQWGLGSGYKQRVEARQGAWFDEANQAMVEQEIIRVLDREWANVLARVAAMLDTDEST